MADKNSKSDAPRLAKASPFAGSLASDPHQIAREAERIMNSPDRVEVEKAHQAKTESQRAKEVDQVGAVVDVNARSPSVQS